MLRRRADVRPGWEGRTDEIMSGAGNVRVGDTFEALTGEQGSSAVRSCDEVEDEGGGNWLRLSLIRLGRQA
jgi:hypothetical protein